MRPTKEERATLSKDEMLRALWLLDDYIEKFGWHLVKTDGYPEENQHGFWCKLADGSYNVLYYHDGFYKLPEKVYIDDSNPVVAWQQLTVIAMN